MSWLVDLMTYLNIAVILLWASLTAWCFLAARRVIGCRSRPYDDFVALLGALMFNQFLFALRPVVFGAHVDIRQTADLAWSAIAYAVAIVVGVTAAKVLWSYRGLK